MKRLILFLAFSIATASHAADPSLELSQNALNKVLGHLGTMAEGGVSQPYNIHSHDPIIEDCFVVGTIGCPGVDLPGIPTGLGELPLMVCREKGGGLSALPVGEPVSWQWWVSNAYVTISANAMTFTATVLTRVGDHWSEETRTVAASVIFDTANNKLRLHIDNFRVDLILQGTSARLGAEPVNVSKLYSIALDVPPQLFSIPLPAGGYRNINARITSATPSFAPGRLTVSFDVAF